MFETGTVKWFDEAKGFGFIAREQGGDVFVHHSALEASGLTTLQEGQHVKFVVIAGKKGPAASSVSSL